MGYAVLIKCDVNDADYVHSVEPLYNNDIEIVKSIAAKIASFKPYSAQQDRYVARHHHNFPMGPREDMGEKHLHELYDFTEEEKDALDQYFPHGFDGMSPHTLHSIQVIEIKEEVFKLDRSTIYG
jgi:hypothetical protein